MTFFWYSVMEEKLKFVVHGRKEGNKFVLEKITNYFRKQVINFISGEYVPTEDSPRADDESIVILALLSVLFHPAKISNEFTFLTISKNNCLIN